MTNASEPESDSGPGRNRDYFSEDRLSAFDSALLAQWIAFGPIVFQAAKALRDMGILATIADARAQGATLSEVVTATGHSRYAVRVLIEAGLGIKLLTFNADADRYHVTKVGWFLLNDDMTRVNMNFTHDVCYQGSFHLQEALTTGKPAGLRELGDWPTLYEGLSKLAPDVARSWFDFDHFYSSGMFETVLPQVFEGRPRKLLDVGGNTGKFSRQCAAYDPDVRITLADLPGQISLATANIEQWELQDRVSFYPIDLLDPKAELPGDQDVVWMSQFLCCFSEPEIVSILQRCRQSLAPGGRIIIVDTFWDRQRSQGGAFCLQQTSLYFSVIANGNSQMYDSKVFFACLAKAELEIEAVVDDLGECHTLLRCKPAGATDRC